MPLSVTTRCDVAQVSLGDLPQDLLHRGLGLCAAEHLQAVERNRLDHLEYVCAQAVLVGGRLRVLLKHRDESWPGDGMCEYLAQRGVRRQGEVHPVAVETNNVAAENVSTRPAHPQRVLAALHNPVLDTIVPVGQIIAGDAECHCPCSAAWHLDNVERFEFLRWPSHGRRRFGYVDLHNLA